MTVLDQTTNVAPDPLDALISRLRWEVTGFERRSIGEAERLGFDGHQATFHYISTGSLSIETRGTSMPVTEGDFALLPRGGSHSLTATGVSEVYSGTMALEHSTGSALDRHLPELMLACGFLLREPLVAGLLEGMRAEQDAARPGSASVVTSLANVVATAAIRSWIEKDRGEGANEWLVSLRDPYIARALEAIHADPASPWTVASLARVASSSRSIFSERFRETVGEPPARYVSRVRMERAMGMLERGLSVTQTASNLGYTSDIAFSRAFRRFAGAAPSSWRRGR
jgi:AraC-like DNA-binding protein